MFGKLVLCGLLAFTLGAPAPDERKCSPMQWEAAVIGKVAQVQDNKPVVINLMGMTSNDYTNKMIAFHEVVDAAGYTVKFSTVTDYNKMMKYDYFPESKTCNVTKVTDKLPIFCSDSGTLSHSMIMGEKMVDAYHFETTHAGTKIKGTVSMFRDSFTPVTEVIEQDYAGVPQMVAMQYGNVTLSIKDNKVFEIPSYCKH